MAAEFKTPQATQFTGSSRAGTKRRRAGVESLDAQGIRQLLVDQLGVTEPIGVDNLRLDERKTKANLLSVYRQIVGAVGELIANPVDDETASQTLRLRVPPELLRSGDRKDASAPLLVWIPDLLWNALDPPVGTNGFMQFLVTLPTVDATQAEIRQAFRDVPREDDQPSDGPPEKKARTAAAAFALPDEEQEPVQPLKTIETPVQLPLTPWLRQQVINRALPSPLKVAVTQLLTPEGLAKAQSVTVRRVDDRQRHAPLRVGDLLDAIHTEVALTHPPGPDVPREAALWNGLWQSPTHGFVADLRYLTTRRDPREVRPDWFLEPEEEEALA